ncbi:MAG: hypothetical protein AAFP69_01660 [Planctomycetota bacterium]
MDNVQEQAEMIEQLRRENAALLAERQRLNKSNASLQQRVTSLATTNQSLVQDAKDSNDQIAKLQTAHEALREEFKKPGDEFDTLYRRFFRRQSERFEDAAQLVFEFANGQEIEDAIEGVKTAIEGKQNNDGKNKPGRPRRRKIKERFPDSLPRQEQVFDLPEEEKAGLVCIGSDVVESACFVSAKSSSFAKCF